MLLDVAQRKTLNEVLTRRFPRIEDLTDFLFNQLSKNLDEIGTGTLIELRRSVILVAEADEWTIDLLEALRDTSGPEVRSLLDSMGTIEEIKEARFHDDCYVDRYPLANRKELRERLRAATAPGGPRILLVKGDRYSGKSHALRHIRHVAKTLAIPLAEIALRRYATGEEIQPKDFGVAVAHALDLDLPVALDEKPSRWSVSFLTWLAGKLGPRRQLWVAIDDFEPEKLKVALPPAVDDFIFMLAESVAESITSMRLFLINYDKELPTGVKPHLKREPVPPVSDDDLVDFFVLFYRDHMPPTLDETVATDAVARARRVRDKMAGDPAVVLELMRDALIEQCEELAP